ncbi:MAG: hypothetical protein NTX71_02070 [Candidatus Aureabacteria bacterium]|nr:hypothetical protein [Candidatus Auribacterota bacterium]
MAVSYRAAPNQAVPADAVSLSYAVRLNATGGLEMNMSEIRFNKWSGKNILAAAAGIAVVLWVEQPYKSRLGFAYLGMLAGNQVSCLLDNISRKCRILGFLVTLWNIYSFFTMGSQIPARAPDFLQAFWWGFGFLAWFPHEELAIVRLV